MTERNKLTDLQERWLTALESGEYKQGREWLFDGEGYCCLGVALTIISPKSKGLRACARANAPRTVVRGLHLHNDLGDMIARRANRLTLAGLNDDGHLAFPEIAAIIRAEPWLVFTNFDVPEADQ